jgi:hypothetical protein
MGIVNDLINGHGEANNPPNDGNLAGLVLKKWRAKVDCIYQKAYVTAGTVVQAAEMENANFEEAQKAKD